MSALCAITRSMVEEFQTSFIPKRVVEPTEHRSSAGMGLLTLLGIIVFIVSLLSAAGVFLYDRYLDSALQTKQASLERAQNAFEPELIRELSRLNKKFDLANRLLRNHLALSSLFSVLEKNTLQTVRFSDFHYSSDGKSYNLSMKGEAASFASVALQSDVFGKTRAITNPIFSDLNLDQRGNVTFNFKATVDPAFLRYTQTASPVDSGSSTPQTSNPSAGASGSPASLPSNPSPIGSGPSAQ